MPHPVRRHSPSWSEDTLSLKLKLYVTIIFAGATHWYWMWLLCRAFENVLSCLKWCSVCWDKSAKGCREAYGSGRVPKDLAFCIGCSFTWKKWKRRITSLGVISGRNEGLGSLCIRSITSSMFFRSRRKAIIRLLRYEDSSSACTDSGMPQTLMLLWQDLSSMTANLSLIHFCCS